MLSKFLPSAVLPRPKGRTDLESVMLQAGEDAVGRVLYERVAGFPKTNQFPCKPIHTVDMTGSVGTDMDWGAVFRALDVEGEYWDYGGIPGLDVNIRLVLRVLERMTDELALRAMDRILICQGALVVLAIDNSRTYDRRSIYVNIVELRRRLKDHCEDERAREQIWWMSVTCVVGAVLIAAIGSRSSK